MYASAETLYRTTIAANPGCVLAHNNLGKILAGRGAIDEAVVSYRNALTIDPNCVEAHNNLGNILAARGQVEPALAEYHETLRIEPRLVPAHNNLGTLLAGQGRLAEARAEYEEALRLRPNFAEAHHNLAGLLVGRGQFDEAVAHYLAAIRLKPDFDQARHALDAIVAAERQWLGAHPQDVACLNNVAWSLATNPLASLRNGAEAVEYAQRAVTLTGGREPAILGTLAAAYAEAGRFPEAARTARKALDLAARQHNSPLAESIGAKIPLYEAGNPFPRRSPLNPNANSRARRRSLHSALRSPAC